MRCLPYTSFALLQLKQEIVFGSTFGDSNTYKMKSWMEGKDCCEWDGVTCSTITGHLIGLDLSFSSLQGPLSSNSSLFSLRQLQRLNLAYNDFSPSKIPSSFAQLSRLTHLNLSNSVFSGQMPYEITLLFNMISLDLSDNEMSLSLLYSTTTKLAQNMTKLEELHLDYVDLSSPLPKSIANLSSLTSLSLSGCNLYGEFLQNIFHLPKIQAIDVSFNNNISVFFGRLTSSVKNLSRLSFLDLGSNNFNGQLPSILFELPSLQYLDLGFNQYRGPLTIPNVPFSSQLTNLYLYLNKLTQKIPRSIFEMKKLDELNLSENDLSGTIEMSMFSKLSQLRALYLSDNNLSVVTNTITNSTLIFKLNYLGLASCNITEFPKFLKTQNELKLLDFSNNNIEGKIPKWFFCIGVETLDSLDMSANFITGWEQEMKVLLWKVLQTLDLSHSRFRVTFLVN
ncbi:hypothetical protein CsatA_003101 [Cannabis sativa]